MKWDAVLKAAAALVAADPVLSTLYPTIRYTGTGKHVVPCLELMLVADGETELWAPCTVQWDQFCDTLDNLRASERRLRQLFHVETQRDFGGMPMWSTYADGDTLATPDRDGYHGRAIRFVMTPLRARYEPAP